MKNWKTTLAGIITTLSLVPTVLNQLHAVELPHWLVVFGQICAGISYVAQSFWQKDHNVTGGVNKIQVLENEDSEIIGTRPTDR